MNKNVRVLFVGVWVLLACSFASAVVPLSIYPNPVQFGTVAENSSGYEVLYVSNSTEDSVVVSNMSITGTNSANFTFYSSTCVGTIPAGQTCIMGMLFTPSSITTFSANLLVSVQGLKQPITVSLQGTGGNPVPAITSLSPESVYENSSGFTLTVNGTSFVQGAIVYLDNVALPTTFVSATKLTAVVPAADLTGNGSDFVNVQNPPPAGGSSSDAELYIVALDPSLSYVSPISVVAATAPTPIVLEGGNFMTGAKVLWNGKAVPTTYLNSGELQIQPTAAQLAAASIVQLAVSNPAPGGLSTAIDFNVTYPAKVTILDLPANDIVWDPYAQRIYASLPSSYGTEGNTIAVINPATGRVTGYYFAGSEPNQLALSSDSKYLYAGLNGNGSVQRLILPNFTPDINIGLGSNDGYENTALSMQIYPSDPHSFAVAEGATGCCGTAGLYFYTDSTQLPDYITYPSIGDLVFANATTLYGYYEDTVSEVTVNSSGGTLGTQWYGLLEGTTIEYAAGLIYDNSGRVLDPQTGLLVGSYDVSGGCCSSSTQIVADSPINRVFALGNTPFFNGFGITSYNLTKFTPIAVANLSQLNSTSGVSFIPWGSNGLAFILQAGCCGTTTSQVVLVQSPAMVVTAGTSKNPVPVPQSLSPANTTHGIWNFPLTVKGTGFVPGSQVTWNGTTLTVGYVSATQLTVYVPAANVASAGTANVVVSNPAPGGGSASALSFTIN